MTPSNSPDSGLREFVAAGPCPQRLVLRAALALMSRPRGRALLAIAAPETRMLEGLASMGRYDDPDVAKPLGWDADAIVARGRELRRSEGRP